MFFPTSCKPPSGIIFNFDFLKILLSFSFLVMPLAEIIYSVALLHDIGRFLEAKNGTPHEIASAELAKNILFSCDYNENEVEMILQVILQHRGSKKEKTTRDCGGTKVQMLSDLMYEADKMSRNCFCCEAYEACNWTEERKNAPIVW